MNVERDETNPMIASYFGAVRDHLGHLEADDLTEIIEDLREHLDDVLAELGDAATWDTLIARIGTPAEYAAELRAAAGLPVPEPAARAAGFGRRLLRFLAGVFAGVAVACAGIGITGMLFVDADAVMWMVPSLISSVAAVACVLWLTLRAEDRQAELRSVPGAVWALKLERWIRQKPWGEPTLEYVRSLRPAWWVLRAAALGVVVTYVATVGLGLAVFLAAVVGSVWLGRKTAAGELRGGRLAVLNFANGAALLATAIVIGTVAGNVIGQPVEYAGDPAYDDDGYVDGDEYYEEVGYSGDEWSEEYDGELVNIFAYGPDGKLLTGVRLYDQHGRPLELPVIDCYEGATPEESFVVLSPWGRNVYPRLSVSGSEQGNCGDERLEPPFGDRLPDVPGAEAPEATGAPADK